MPFRLRQLVIRILAVGPLATLPLVAHGQEDWLDGFPPVTAVAHGAYEELKVTAAGNKIVIDDDSVAVNLAGTFVVLREILQLKYDDEWWTSAERKERYRRLVASYMEAELTIGKGAAGRQGYIRGEPPVGAGLGCGNDMACYRRWFLVHLNANTSRAEYRERFLRRLFPCGDVARELNDQRQEATGGMDYTPSPAATLTIDPDLAGLAPAGCEAYGGDANANGLCDGWEAVPKPEATACEVDLLKVRRANDGGLTVSIGRNGVTAGAKVPLHVVRSATPVMDASARQVWLGVATVRNEGGSAALQASVPAGPALKPDPSRPYLLVDTTLPPSRGPVHCEQPLVKWLGRQLEPTPAGLHGPYPTLDSAIQQDQPSRKTLQLTERFEYGFVILRDWRLPAGGYYTTAPVSSSDPWYTLLKRQPLMNGQDYSASLTGSFEGSCEEAAEFVLVATVHSHPDPGWPRVDNFSMQDFQQAVELRRSRPRPRSENWGGNPHPTALDAIVMLNRHGGCVHTFYPAEGDQPFTDEELEQSPRDATEGARWKAFARRSPAGTCYR